MPVTDVTIWREIAGWFAGIIAAIALAFWGLVTKWANHRFKAVDDRIDEQDDKNVEQDKRLDALDKQMHEHHEELAVLRVHMENGANERKRIEDGVKEVNGKLDKLIERR